VKVKPLFWCSPKRHGNSEERASTRCGASLRSPYEPTRWRARRSGISVSISLNLISAVHGTATVKKGGPQPMFSASLLRAHGQFMSKGFRSRCSQNGFCHLHSPIRCGTPWGRMRQRRSMCVCRNLPSSWTDHAVHLCKGLRAGDPVIGMIRFTSARQRGHSHLHR
jgi:hypothetical protein